MKQNTTQATLFELVYGRTAILPVKIEVNTYPTEPITEENFQETLRAADNIQKSQEKQKERHDNQLPDKPVEFKIGDKILLYHIKAEKQWKEILGNGAYKLRLDNKILTKAAYGD
ncbi:hypothetical protein G9A89_006650 [Geosiphon pyriformis]|nr:hypothetical protein G9A89_006650 [Geosiphon pyriformis]